MVNMRNLTVLAYGNQNGFRMWHYKTDDHFPTILLPSYFKDAEDLLAPGDMLIITSVRNGIAIVKSAYIERATTSGPVIRLMSAGRMFHHDDHPHTTMTVLEVKPRIGDGVARQPALEPPGVIPLASTT